MNHLTMTVHMYVLQMVSKKWHLTNGLNDDEQREVNMTRSI